MRNKFKVGDKVRVRVSASVYTIELIDSSGMIKLKQLIFGYNPENLVPAYLGTAVIRSTRNGGYRTTLVGANGEVMFTSEVYTTKAKAKQTARLMKDFELVDKTKEK